MLNIPDSYDWSTPKSANFNSKLVGWIRMGAEVKCLPGMPLKKEQSTASSSPGAVVTVCMNSKGECKRRVLACQTLLWLNPSAIYKLSPEIRWLDMKPTGMIMVDLCMLDCKARTDTSLIHDLSVGCQSRWLVQWENPDIQVTHWRSVHIKYDKFLHFKGELAYSWYFHRISRQKENV